MRGLMLHAPVDIETGVEDGKAERAVSFRHRRSGSAGSKTRFRKVMAWQPKA
jgi:hypothetical protein